VLRLDAGKVTEFVEDPQSPINQTVMTLKSASGMDVRFDFVYMNVSVGMGTDSMGKSRGKSGSGTIINITEISTDKSPDPTQNPHETCTRQTSPGVKCTCDLRTLRPLQGAIGMEEVRKKSGDIVDTDKLVTGKKTRLDLAYDPIKIVRGPIGRLYVTDHHHGARAWLEAGHIMGTCQIQEVRMTDDNGNIYSYTVSTDWTQFWADLKTKKLVRLADQNGNPIAAERFLPETLKDLPDDPYRTLAWRVRKGGGFCRALMTGNTEFAEFQWADWLRTRITPSPQEGKNWSNRKREAAIALAKTSAAAGLPGYRGDKPPGYTCPPDPDLDPQ
jgi:hypothetical protein